MYNNSRAVPNGFAIGNQSPIDDRLIFASTSEMIDLGLNDFKAFRYYEGMKSVNLSNFKEYIWVEAAAGLLTTGFTYPLDYMASGIDYSGRTFNFVDLSAYAIPDAGDPGPYVPLAGTATGFPVLGSVYFGAAEKLMLGTDALSGFNTLNYFGLHSYSAVDTAFGSMYFKGYQPILLAQNATHSSIFEIDIDEFMITSNLPTFAGLKYSADFSAYYTSRSLVDKAYVQSLLSSATWGSILGTLTDQTDLLTALNGKEPFVAAGGTSQYRRGDKTWQTLDKAAVSLGNVDNTADLDKPVSTATTTAINLTRKQYLMGSASATLGSSTYYAAFNGGTVSTSLNSQRSYFTENIAIVSFGAYFSQISATADTTVDILVDGVVADTLTIAAASASGFYTKTSLIHVTIGQYVVCRLIGNGSVSRNVNATICNE